MKTIFISKNNLVCEKRRNVREKDSVVYYVQSVRVLHALNYMYVK